jgi:hypothetical protein
MKTQFCPACKGTLTSLNHICPKGTPTRPKDQNHYNQHGLPVVYVEDLASDDTMMFVGLIPSEAVISAYAYSFKDPAVIVNHKYYLNNYHRLTWGKHTVAIGDYCTMTKINR